LSPSTTKSKVTVLALGGTIASAPGGEGGLAGPRLSAEDIVAAVPGIDEVADVEVRNVTKLPSCDLTLDLAVAVAVTGAMRHAGAVSSDGPANLLDAVRTVSSPDARGLGCLVVLNEEVHAAAWVRKLHTSSPAAFQSPSSGPVGWIAEGRPHLRGRPSARLLLEPPTGPVERVPLVKVVLDDDGWWLPRVREMGARGLVLEAMGGGHLPGWLYGEAAELARRIPVVITSRTGDGEVLTSTYGGFDGSETSLMEAGLIPAGALHSLKARMLLCLLVTAGATPAGTRPQAAEERAVADVLETAAAVGSPVYFVHQSTPAAVDAVARARRQGVRASSESCPHYLTLDDGRYQAEHPERWVCCPPLRDQATVEALGRRLETGFIHTVGSDHCCYDSVQKAERSDDVREMPNGLPGVETRLPVVFSSFVSSGRIGLRQLVALTAANPARLNGLYPRKGTIAPGSDADLVVLDPNETREVRAARLHMETDYSPYEGLRVTGWPVTVIAAGRVVLDHDQLIDPGPVGQYLPVAGIDLD
jgi:L-asparaginase/Glu-tRNA(Gln) amidotransferase subunit D